MNLFLLAACGNVLSYSSSGLSLLVTKLGKMRSLCSVT